MAFFNYVRTLNANLKHFIPNGISSIEIHKIIPIPQNNNANGNLINNHIVADSNAPVI